MPDSPHLRLEERGDGILRVHFDKPAKRNALDDDMVVGLLERLEQAENEESVRVVLITAEGDHFCSGFDIVGRNDGAPEVRPRVGSIQRRLPRLSHGLVARMCEIQVPIVAAARGWVAGVGLHVAAAADFTVVADDARVWEPFAQRGFTPDSGGTWLLPRLVGVQRARRMLVLGEIVSGADAVDWGLFHSSVPAGEVDATAEALAVQLASAPTVTVGLAKWLIHTSAEHTFDQHLRAEGYAMELSSRSEDFKEGLQAFVQKRDPEFKGR